MLDNLFSYKYSNPFKVKHPRWQKDFSPLEAKELEIVDFPKIPDDVLVLGTEYPDSETLVTIPFDKEKRITIVIIGDNGSGKSVLAKFIVVDQLHGRYKRPLAVIDPKLDLQTILQKLNNKALIAKLGFFGFRPKAYNYAKFISPMALKIQGAITPENERYQMSLPMLNKIIEYSPTIGLSEVYKLFNTQQGEASARELQTIFLSSKPENSLALEEDIYSIEPKCPPTLESQFKLLKLSKIIGDKGINYPELLMKFKILILEMQVSSKSENTLQDIFADNFVTSLIQDRSLSVSSNNTQGFIDTPFTIFMDEGSVFAGKDKQTSEIMQMITTKYREFSPAKKALGIKTYGCDSVIVSQHFDLDDILIKEADWVIHAKISDDKDAEKLQLRGLYADDIQEAKHLDSEGHPKQFQAVGKQGEKIRFYPLPTLSYM